MKSLLYILFSVLIATISACNAYHAPMKVSGIVSCEGDSAALVHPFITRLSDGKLFAGDKKGYYSVIAAKGDSLAFSYVGTISDTIKVTRRRHDVRLKSYIWGDDELIIVDKSNKLKEDLTSLIDSTDARIGVAIILNGEDTISINGTKEFPMMSVFKFPLALAVANVVEANNSSFNEKVKILKEDLKENTYSPMLKMYGRKDM